MSIARDQTINPASDVSRSVRDKHKEYLLPATILYYKEPLVLTEGKGLRVRDADGNTYLDFFGGILTISVGHANEKVNAAIVAQIGRLSHVSTLYPTLPVVELAERLARLAPGNLQQCFLATSGTEADETAVMHAVSPYCYRCPLKLTYPSCGVACAKDIEELIRTTTTGRIAAFLAEPIQGVGGFITPPPEYFEIAVSIIRKYGGVFICDEVQTGFGRTGAKWWGIEHWGVQPDIMTMAKGVANGLPLGVTIATPEIAASLKTLTISTFGGNPVSCAAANATIQIIEEEKLPQNAEKMGRLLAEGLREIQRRFPKNVGDVRGKGLMVGVELVADETARDRTPEKALTNRVFEESKKRGLLIGKGGLEGNCFRIAPALTVTEADVREAVGILTESFAAAGAH